MKKITERRWEILQEKAEECIKNIPFAHNRKREESYHNSILKDIRQTKKDIKELPKGKKINIIKRSTKNLGNRKWQHFITVVEKIDNIVIERETDCFYFLSNGGRISKEKVLAYI